MTGRRWNAPAALTVVQRWRRHVMIDFGELDTATTGPHPPEIAVFAWAGDGPLILLMASDNLDIHLADISPVIPSSATIEREIDAPPGPGVWLWSGKFKSHQYLDGDWDVWIVGEWRELTADELEFVATGDRLAVLISAGVPEDSIDRPDPADMCQECGSWN